MEQRWIVLTLAFIIGFSYLFSLQSYPAMIPVVMEEFDISYAEASLPMSLASLAGILLALPTWAFIYKWGNKKVGATGLVISSMGGVISSLGGSFLLIVLGRVILGIGGILIIIVSFSMIANWFPPEQGGKAMGIKGLEMPIATILSFNLLPIVIAIYGWRIIFSVYTVILIVSASVFILLFRDKPREGPIVKIFEGWRNKQMWLLGVIWSLSTLSSITYATWAGTFFIELWEIPVNLAFFMASIIMIASIPLAPLMGFMSDRMGKRKIFIVVASLMMGISLISIPILVESFLYLSIALLALSSFRAPIIFALTSEILPRERAGLGFGILFICDSIGMSLGPTLIGVVEDLFPGGGPAFFIMGAFSFLVLIFARFLKTR